MGGGASLHCRPRCSKPTDGDEDGTILFPREAAGETNPAGSPESRVHVQETASRSSVDDSRRTPVKNKRT